MPCFNLSHLIFGIEHEFAIDCVFVMNLKTCLCKIAHIFHDHGELKCESCSRLIQAHPNQTKPKRTELCVWNTFEYAQHDKYIMHFNFTSSNKITHDI